MYYGLDENGNIIMGDTSDILDDPVYQELFPFYPPGSVSSSDLVDDDFFYDSSVSSGDFVLPPSYLIDYDLLAETLATVPSYTVYPNTSAVNVFNNVFIGLPSKVDYVVVSGSDSSSAYMYYTLSGYSISGNTITLNSPVVQCSYYSQRVNTNTYYYYTTNEIGDTTFTLGNQLVYTNLIESYPNLPSDSRKTGHSLAFDLIFPIASSLIVSIVFINISRRRAS